MSKTFEECISPKLLAVAIYLVVTFSIAAAILVMCDGHFIYSLDDTYIALAQAEHIAQGNYGINNGEITSACSSVLWPFLITVGAGTSWHFLVPFVLNVLFGALTVWFIGLIVEDCPWEPDEHRRYARQLGVTILFIFAGNLVSLVFIGLEHSLQVLLAVICARALLKAWAGQVIPNFYLAAAIFAPAVRYEMFAVVAAVALALISQQRWKAAVVVTLASMALPAALAVYLVSHGLPPLPNSVLAKTGAFEGSSFSLIQWIGNILQTAAHKTKDLPARVTEFACMAVLASLAWKSQKRQSLVLWGVFMTLALHCFFGRFGGHQRYEIFAVIVGTVVLFRVIAPTKGRAFFVGCGLLFICSFTYLLGTLVTPLACQNIYDQQYQMHRFLVDYYKKNVAVNDLGLASYQRGPGIYVLDLGGLASNEALRQSRKDAPWLEGITQEHQVGLVMIYPDWFASIPTDWIPVGTLCLNSPKIATAETRVVFYSTPEGNSNQIRSELTAFAPTLPAHASLQMPP